MNPFTEITNADLAESDMPHFGRFVRLLEDHRVSLGLLALRYTLNQWEALRRYTDTGFLAMDNNATERINKLIARGRVNWPSAARAAAKRRHGC